MNNVVRNLEPRTVQKIDELAKQEGISREQFLRNQILRMSQSYEEDEFARRLEKLVKETDR
ncbi:hypothetical protein [Salicibibacter kimchii]|uniref:Ribbon-helix-helix protein, CopG family n=1 Tax=Salicibibacter kimchii TaxID=2099786 RepID=A0A345C2D4_9BACI|nr:hypothetical protein [Salicibibacter kimchii]AXF57365.1 hypothetical protein DT065_16105 [Salicibibacter kimchii]